ncbi:hypothetical protein CJ030_MR7G012043 [Morella rubra]|uniref:Uncharacterized protein n=1 Tax=Morella rubra TaxID=262757 RepID=A0A6A1UYC5_9ROSI|nr:hypothetical protein CJ030_MR7G012043 [Morella rubra]
MQSLASICETILPPLPLNSLEAPNEGQPTNAVCSFSAELLASQPPLPDQVNENAESPAWEAIGYHVDVDEDPREVPERGLWRRVW